MKIPSAFDTFELLIFLPNKVGFLMRRFTVFVTTVALALSGVGLASTAKAAAFDGNNGTINCDSGTAHIQNKVLDSHKGCSGSVVIPEGVTAIGISAFTGASALYQIAIPSSLTSFGASAFKNVTSLSKVYFLGNAPTVSANAFANIAPNAKAYIKSGATGFGDVGATWNGLVTTRFVPDGKYLCTTGVESNLTPKFTIWGGFLSDGKQCVGGVKIPNGVAGIGDNAFKGATLLTKITIPPSVKEIGESAFMGASALSSVYFFGSPPSLGANAFANLAPNAKLYIKPGVTSYGKVGAVWNGLTVAEFVPDGTYLCTTGQESSSTPNFKVTDGVLSEGTQCEGIVAIPDGVVSIASGTFEGATSITTIYIPSSVRSIGNNAFNNAISLANFYFLGNAPTIGVDTFKDVPLEAKAYIKRGVTSFTAVGQVWNGLTVEEYRGKAKAAKLPSITGKAVATAAGKNKLMANKGIWVGYPDPTFSYQWYACAAQVMNATDKIPSDCKAIAKEINSTLAVTSPLNGKFVAVAVTAASAGTSATKWLSKSTTQVPGYYTFRLSHAGKPWLADKTLDNQPYWPKTPKNWRSFLAYYSAQEAPYYEEETVKKYGVGRVTYTLRDPKGNPVVGEKVTLTATGRGKARSWGTWDLRSMYTYQSSYITNAKGQVTFDYYFNTDLNNFTPTTDVRDTPEPRPKSILKKFCYTTCPADWPNSRGYVKGKYPKGLKANEFLQVDLVPNAPELEEKGIDKDQVWVHVINPTQQKPKPFFSVYSRVRIDYLGINGGQPQDKVGGLIQIPTGAFYGAPFTKVEKFTYVCSQQHKSISFSLPRDCKAVKFKDHLDFARVYVIPASARNKYIMGGIRVTNREGSTLVLSATTPTKIR